MALLAAWLLSAAGVWAASPPLDWERFLPEVRPAAGMEAPQEVFAHPLEAPAGEVSVLYFFAWEDETHPWFGLDQAYRLFRKLYYGSARDLEYVWVRAEASTGRVLQLVFEAPDVRGPLVGHEVRNLTDAEFKASPRGRPLLWVTSWNHLFEAHPPGPLEAAPAPPLRIYEMTPQHWSALRMSRRSLPPKELLSNSK